MMNTLLITRCTSCVLDVMQGDVLPGHVAPLFVERAFGILYQMKLGLLGAPYHVLGETHVLHCMRVGSCMHGYVFM